MLTNQCKRRLTLSPKRVYSTNQLIIVTFGSVLHTLLKLKNEGNLKKKYFFYKNKD